MDSTLSSGPADPHHDVAVAPVAANQHRSGVEDALAKLAHRAARDVPDPQAWIEGDGVVAVPQAPDPSGLVTASDASTVPQAAEPSVPVTGSSVCAGRARAEPSVQVPAADGSAVGQAAEPSVRATASDVSAVPRVAVSSARTTASDVSAAPQVAGPSVLATIRPAEFRNVPFPSDKPSLGSRAARAVTRFLVAVCVGVAGSLAWQSYGGAAREIIADRVPQLAWIAARPMMNQTADPAAATEQAAAMPAIEETASPPAVAQAATDTPHAAAAQGTPVAEPVPQQAGANVAAPTAPAAPSSDQQQLETMSRDIGALRQSVEQLTARQERMTREMAKLQAVEMSRHRMSAPPPHATAAPRKPPMPPQAPPQVSSAVPSAGPSPQPPPLMASEPPQHAPPPPAAPPQPATAPQPLRPPMPVLGQP
jgi:uncharacterized coiled-coil protein SlyX